MAICRCTNIYFIWHAYAMLPFHVTIIYMLDARVYIVRRRRIKNIIFETSKSCSLEGIKRKKRWNDRMKNEKSKDKKKNWPHLVDIDYYFTSLPLRTLPIQLLLLFLTLKNFSFFMSICHTTLAMAGEWYRMIASVAYHCWSYI